MYKRSLVCKTMTISAMLRHFKLFSYFLRYLPFFGNRSVNDLVTEHPQ